MHTDRDDESEKTVGVNAVDNPFEWICKAMDDGHEAHLTLADGGVTITDYTGRLSVYVSMSTAESNDLRRMVTDEIRRRGLEGEWRPH